MTKKIEIKTNKHGDDYIEATITFKRKVYIGKGKSEISEDVAKELTLTELEYLSGSNDGSEVLCNINEEQITFDYVENNSHL